MIVTLTLQVLAIVVAASVLLLSLGSFVGRLLKSGCGLCAAAGQGNCPKHGGDQ